MSSKEDPEGPHWCASGSAAVGYRAQSGTSTRSSHPGPEVSARLRVALCPSPHANATSGGPCPPSPPWTSLGLRPQLLSPLRCRFLAESLRLLGPQTGDTRERRRWPPFRPSQGDQPLHRPRGSGPSRRSPFAHLCSRFSSGLILIWVIFFTSLGVNPSAPLSHSLFILRLPPPLPPTLCVLFS